MEREKVGDCVQFCESIHLLCYGRQAEGLFSSFISGISYLIVYYYLAACKCPESREGGFISPWERLRIGPP